MRRCRPLILFQKHFVPHLNEQPQAHNTLVKTALMQALELVARHQPGLLLAQNPDPPPWEMYPATPSFGKLWNYLTSLDPMNVEEERDDDEDSKGQTALKMRHVRMIHETSNIYHIVIYEKAFPILIRHSQPLLPEKKLLSISVTYTVRSGFLFVNKKSFSNIIHTAHTTRIHPNTHRPHRPLHPPSIKTDNSRPISIPNLSFHTPPITRNHHIRFHANRRQHVPHFFN